MVEFLESYGILIVLGLLLVFMLRRGHGHQMGCGMGCGLEPDQEKKTTGTAGETGEHRGGCH